jgi:hypothetical protein
VADSAESVTNVQRLWHESSFVVSEPTHKALGEGNASQPGNFSNRAV